MSSLAARLRSLRSNIDPPSMAPEREAAFARRCRERFSRHGAVFAVICVGFSLLWWPTDYVVYEDLPQYIGPTQIWRTVISLIAVAYLILTRGTRLGRHDDLLFGAAGLLLCATMGYTAGLMGGPDRPHVHLLYVFVLGTLLMPLRLGPRASLTVAFAAALLLGYLVPFPEHRSSPYLRLTVSVMLAMIGVSVTFGHVVFLLIRSNFQQAALLAESNLLLEARVAERTRELRGLLSHLETTREDERGHIAREIHDRLGQELTAQRLTLAIAEDCLDGEPATARTKLAEMRGLLDQMMTTVRALTVDLRPPVLHDLGLGEAARWLARRTEELSGVVCEISMTGDPAPLDGERRDAVFQILEESLRNVARHARAKSVSIDITTTVEALVLRVTDDGVGPEDRPVGRGFGVLGMRERARALGGDFSLRGRPEGGTEVTCRLSLAGASGGTS
jgi:signal transduction histidine kinase